MLWLQTLTFLRVLSGSRENAPALAPREASAHAAGESGWRERLPGIELTGRRGSNGTRCSAAVLWHSAAGGKESSPCPTGHCGEQLEMKEAACARGRGDGLMWHRVAVLFLHDALLVVSRMCVSGWEGRRSERRGKTTTTTAQKHRSHR